jgi:hypothetical protein
MQNREKSEYDSVMSSYFGDDQVTALINLKVETKDADVIAEAIAENKADMKFLASRSNSKTSKPFWVDTVASSHPAS